MCVCSDKLAESRKVRIVCEIDLELTHKFDLLKLPKEIRLLIYEQIFPSGERLFLTEIRDGDVQIEKRFTLPSAALMLLRTCHQIQEEAYEVFYGRNEFLAYPAVAVWGMSGLDLVSVPFFCFFKQCLRTQTKALVKLQIVIRNFEMQDELEMESSAVETAEAKCKSIRNRIVEDLEFFQRVVVLLAPYWPKRLVWTDDEPLFPFQGAPFHFMKSTCKAVKRARKESGPTIFNKMEFDWTREPVEYGGSDMEIVSLKEPVGWLRDYFNRDHLFPSIEEICPPDLMLLDARSKEYEEWHWRSSSNGRIMQLRPRSPTGPEYWD